MDAAEVRPDSASFDRVARALSAEAGSSMWRADLSSRMTEAMAPGVAAVRSALMGGGGGGSHEGTPLLPAIAAKVKAMPLASGAVIVAGKNGMPRGFKNAPKRFNQRSFRRRVYGSDTWVQQIGVPGWFDDRLEAMHPRLRAAALDALDGRARRISRKV